MRYFRTRLLLLPLMLLTANVLFGQASDTVSARAKGPFTVKRGSGFEAPLTITVKKGFHINSHQPDDKYLIPLSLRWDSPLADAGETAFPQPAMQRFAFSDKQMSVFEGTFELKQAFRIKPDASRGFASLTGSLRYQACNDKECLPPASVPVRVTVDIQ